MSFCLLEQLRDEYFSWWYVHVVYTISPEVTLCGWRGYKPPIINHDDDCDEDHDADVGGSGCGGGRFGCS